MYSERVFHRAEFCLELSEETFSGYTDGDTWNGFACPYFLYDEAVRLLEVFGNRWKFDETRDAFLVWVVGAQENDEPEVFESIKIQVNGEDIKTYAIGAYSWVWDTCEQSHR